MIIILNKPFVFSKFTTKVDGKEIKGFKYREKTKFDLNILSQLSLKKQLSKDLLEELITAREKDNSLFDINNIKEYDLIKKSLQNKSLKTNATN